MSTKEFRFIVKIFLAWLGLLFLILFFAVKFIPSQKDLVGGGYLNYIKNPYLLSFGNFDGEHYISIAKSGYGLGEYAFFPLYPLLINGFGKIFGTNLFVLNFVGVLISLTAFFVGLLGFFKLLRIDFSEKFSKTVILLLVLFPTSFYFAAVYSESLFFALLVWTFYFARRGNYFAASILGMFLTATRFVGIIILPAILFEWFLQNRTNRLKHFPDVVLAIPIGIFAYMYYLEKKVHDIFAFFTSLTAYGEQRSNHLITLPQVFYRYLFKILPNLNFNFFPGIFSTGFEFFIGIFYLFLSIIAFARVRFSYSIILLLGYLLPTFSGSFSSLPRYVLILFPAYIIFTQFVSKSKFYLFVFSAISFILLVISFSLFARGYWIS